MLHRAEHIEHLPIFPEIEDWSVEDDEELVPKMIFLRAIIVSYSRGDPNQIAGNDWLGKTGAVPVKTQSIQKTDQSETRITPQPALTTPRAIGYETGQANSSEGRHGRLRQRRSHNIPTIHERQNTTLHMGFPTTSIQRLL
jgi:hypothetical protein